MDSPQEKVEALAKKFKEICKCAASHHVGGHVFLKRSVGGKQEIIVNLFYLYDPEKHKDREFKSCGVNWLANLIKHEIDAISSTIIKLVDEEFNFELYKFDMGIFTYCLTPKN